MENKIVNINTGRHSGWSEEENRLLWETADEAQQQGLPLKQVFEQIARQTGRRPNSIRNYYYAQVRQREGIPAPTPRFVPFAEGEVETLVEQVLRARAGGQSVRACLQEMSGGNHSLMLRYQNKYRSVLKNRPELIARLTEKLNAEGIECEMPEVRTRMPVSIEAACHMLNATAQSVSDAEIIRSCDVLTRLMLSGRTPADNDNQIDRLNVRLDLYRLALTEKTRLIEALCLAADDLTLSMKEYLVQDEMHRHERMDEFCEKMREKIGTLEGRISEALAPASEQA